MTVYETLAAIAERELELVTAGATDGLTELRARRDAILAALPPAPPPAARPALERTAELQARVTDVLRQRLEETGAELRRLNRGRTAMRGYAPPIAPLKLVDQAG